jgi:hypothetical protein
MEQHSSILNCPAEDKVPLRIAGNYYTPSVKNAIYKWRKTHKDQYDKYHNEQQKVYNMRHRDAILAKKKEAYAYKIFLNNESYVKECQYFREILLEE